MALPQYTYDPVTQTYKLLPPEQAPVTGLGSLYNAGGDGNGVSASSGGRGPGQGVSSAAQNIGLGAMAYGNMLGGFMPGGTLVGMAGNAIAGQQVDALADAQANLGAMDAGPGRGMGIATVSDPEGNTFGFSSPATVAAADQATFGLASMNAQTAAQNQAAAQQAQVANTAQSVAEGVAVSAEADAAQDAANAADAAAAASNTSDGGNADGAGTGATGTAGVGSEAGHAADGNNASDGPAGGEGERAGGVIHSRYATGGLASARKTENMGRGDDTMLVHMTPNEVRGLQAIAMAHGGSLTINPKTGLVEAGFLDSILPMVAGAALNFAVPGLGAAMGGFAIPALVGGASYLANPKQGLMGGLMAGLSAYGGQNLAAGLTGAGSIGAEQAAAQGGYDELIKGGFIDQSGNLTQAGLQANNAAMQAAAQGGMDTARQQFTNQGVFDQLSQSAKGIANQPMSETIRAFGGKSGVASIAAPVLSSAFSAEEEQKPGGTQTQYIRPYSFDFKPESEVNPDFAYRTGKPGESTAEQRYFTPTFTSMGVFKGGTEPGPSFYGTPTAEQYALYSKPKSDPLGLANGGIANFDDEPGYDGMAKGGLKDGAFVVPADVVSHLGNGSNDAGQKLLARGLGARPIKGRGDGMSDSIPTTIEGKQPARVADGEAYISPEVVKKVGAKRLYAMMDKIRQARTGTKQQAPQVDPRKFMPA